MKFQNEELRTPSDIVNTFAKLFERSFNKNLANSMCVSRRRISSNTTDIQQITENEVSKAIKKLKPSMTAGPDSIPWFLVRDCAKPLTIIFN